MILQWLLLRGGHLRKKENNMDNKYVADEGYVFALKDLSEVYDDVLYLGKYDDPSNYVMITLDEAEKLKEELNKQNEKSE